MLDNDPLRFFRCKRLEENDDKESTGLGLDVRVENNDADYNVNNIFNTGSQDISNYIFIYEEHYNDQGESYYYFPSTGERMWEKPKGNNIQILSQHQDAEENWYWLNNQTKETKWI